MIGSKYSKIALTAALSMGLVTSAGMADDPPVGSEQPWEALGDASDLYSVTLPNAGGRNFVLMQGTLDLGFSLGCDGFGDFRVFTQVAQELERTWEYVQQNATNLALNYLIYSNPTLHAIYQHLQVKRDMLLDQALVSCSSVRREATNQRESRWEAIGLNACLEDGKTPAVCNDGNKIQEYIAKEREKWLHSRELSGANSGSLKDLIKAAMALPEGKDPILKNPPRSEQEESKNASEDLSFGIENLVADEESTVDGTKIKPRAQTLDEYVENASEAYAGWLARVSSMEPGLRSGSRALGKLETTKANKRMSPTAIARLDELRRRDSKEYENVIEIMAREMAIANAADLIARMRAAAVNFKVTGKLDPALESPEQVDSLLDSIELLEAELNVMRVRSENHERQARIERDILGGN